MSERKRERERERERERGRESLKDSSGKGVPIPPYSEAVTKQRRHFGILPRVGRVEK
jgi:hypothetical protein